MEAASYIRDFELTFAVDDDGSVLSDPSLLMSWCSNHIAAVSRFEGVPVPDFSLLSEEIRAHSMYLFGIAYYNYLIALRDTAF